MKQVKKVKKHVEQSYKEVGVVCDICEQKIGWEAYKDDEPTLNVGYGDNYPESDCRDFYEFDVCESCFTERVRPLFKEHFGKDFREIDSDDRFDIASRVYDKTVELLPN